MSPRLDPRLRGFAAAMRNAPTPPEAVLWSRLKGSQTGYKFRRQAVIGGIIADFYCPAVRLIVELDGRTHDGEADVRRDAALTAGGYSVLRFSNAELAVDLDRVVGAIHAAAATLSPPPPGRAPRVSRPSPEGEGEA